ncbi:MAG: hypothetical protein ACK56P_12325 [Chitinophagales bacterium]|jgi:hypothetical protein
MENLAFKISVPTMRSAQVSRLAKPTFPTLQINVTKALQRRLHRKKVIARSRTQERITIGTPIKLTWYNGREWKQSILQFAKDNQLEKKIKIHAPEYLETMSEIYLQRDIHFFEQLVLSVAFLRVGLEGSIENWFWTEEEDFLEAHRLVKMNLTTSPPRVNSSPKSRLEVLDCIRTQFKDRTFTTRQIRPFLNYTIAYITNVCRELLESERIVWIGMNRYARVYQLHKNAIL